MNTLDTQFSVNVQTPKGNVPIESLNIGDCIICHEYGCELEILGFQDREERAYEVTFNDGRKTFYTGRELDYFDKRPFKQNRINYNHRVITPLYPDPYTAGALLIYGDQTDKYLNLPTGINIVNNILSHKYQLNYGGTVAENGNSYFRYNGDAPDKLITWEEFFSNYTFTGKPQNCQNPPIVPLEYQRASISDRIKFIRGVFDMGYSDEYFKHSCGIAHTSREKLVEVQKMLCSLGIVSEIDYDQTMMCTMVPAKLSTSTSKLDSNGGNVDLELSFKVPSTYKNRDYRLYVLGKYSSYPGFFYGIDSIENMISNDKKYKKYLRFNLGIKSVESHGKGVMRSLILKEPNVSYTTDNFLPKLSVKKS